MDFLLHAENLDRIFLRGKRIKKQLQRRTKTVKTMTAGVPDPDISVLIRTKNDMQYLEQLFSDIHAQEFTGNVEIIVVDTSSTDGTAEFARSHGAKVISLTQAEFTYPKALNAGFEAARHPYVVTLVGHSNLTNRYMFKALTLHAQEEKFGGIYCLPLVNWNASFMDRFILTLWPEATWKRVRHLERTRGGMLGANSAIVSRAVWQKLGGYDERYAGGGEDTALGRTMIECGFTVVMEPLCAVYHSHGLSFWNTIKQCLHWAQVAGTKPQTFNTDKIHARRPDLR
jgi:glycosyltransferase involved in cell wall biosynthesis